MQQGSGDEEAQQNPTPGSPRTGIRTSTQLREQFFVRFDVHVVGGKPWRVRVRGEASSWTAGEIPTPLHGADVPHWLEGRVNSLEVAIYQRLKGHAVKVGKERDPEAEAAAPPAAAPLDVARFGKLPPEAGRVVAEVQKAGPRPRHRRAARPHGRRSSPTPPARRRRPTPRWSCGRPIPASSTSWSRCSTAGCALDPGGKQVVCPAAAPPSGAPRAVFQASGQAWKLVSFTID